MYPTVTVTYIYKFQKIWTWSLFELTKLTHFNKKFSSSQSHKLLWFETATIEGYKLS